MGRPKSNIDWDRVSELLRAHCDGVAIASYLGVDPETLYRRCKIDNNIGFTDFAAQKKAEGIMLVEESIYKDALSKGGTDRIFWLKNKGGWRDKIENTHSINLIEPITGIKIIRDGAGA